MEVGCIPETLGKSKTASPSHQDLDMLLNIKTRWAGLTSASFLWDPSGVPADLGSSWAARVSQEEGSSALLPTPG